MQTILVSPEREARRPMSMHPIGSALRGMGHPARLQAARAALCAAALAASMTAGGADPVRAVTIEGMAYQPATLTVRRNQRVVWVNRDAFPHTVTAVASGGKPAFDSGSIDAGKSWTYVARTPGTYDYVCSFHPGMKARLVVE